MRKVLAFLLLAGAAAVPSLAAPGDRAAEREQTRAERQQAREDRASRAERIEAPRPQRAERIEAARPERVERAGIIERPVRAERIAEPRSRAPEARAEAVGRAQTRDLQALRDDRRQAIEARRSPQEIEARRAPQARPQLPGGSMTRDRIEQRRQETRERIAAARRPAPPVSNVPAPNTQPPAPTVQRPTPAVQWSGNWRDNSRYDWYNHRHRNRSLFHLGFYFDPFGWGYYPYSIGWRMWPSYYSSQYWLHDPWQYRLPYAPPGYRWVRYWDDAVLVDMWSGQVVDVIYNFFW